MFKRNLGWVIVSAIMKKLKNGYHFVNIDHKEKFKLLVPSKFGFLVFKVSTFKTFMHGDLSTLRKPEMQIFHWFNFLNFLLVQFSSSPILGSISTFKTFMRGYLCLVTFLPHESPMCSFTLPDIFFFSFMDYKDILHLIYRIWNTSEKF